MQFATLALRYLSFILIGATTLFASEWTLRATYGSPAVVEVSTVGANRLKIVRIPLGLSVRLQLQEKASSAPTKVAFTTAEHVVSKPLFPESVSPTVAVLDFPLPGGGTSRMVYGIHLGSATLLAKPQNERPIKIAIEVVKPTVLGAAPSQYDATIVELAHRGGIPPSLLKRQIQRETNFNPHSYRYEPLSPGADFALITAVGNTDGKNLRLAHPFSRYRLATVADVKDPALPAGRDLSKNDLGIGPASRLKVKAKDGTIRQLTEDDHSVSARNIYEQNDARQNWSKSNPKWAAEAKLNPALLDFTAQTGLAASYGLMQIMYPTAVSLMHWKDGDRPGQMPAINPSRLFDTPENLAAGDGSLVLGAEYGAEQYLRAHGNSLPPLASADEFFASWYPALNFYNHGTTGCKVDACDATSSCYGRCIIADHSKFLPVAAEKVLR